jgi:RNA polymerase sigma-54 factor
MVVGEGGDHPLRDQEIVDRLKERNIHIARRTVAKYRAELKIPSASRRRKYV